MQGSNRAMQSQMIRLMDFLVNNIPRLSFNRELYRSLIAECPKGPIKAEASDPEVYFAFGPIDGVLGNYDERSNKITIDVIELYATVLFIKQVPVELAKLEFDKMVTRVLAHEGGHWHLEKRHGFLANLERALLRVGFYSIGLSLTLGMTWLAYLMIWGSLVSWLGTHIPMVVAAPLSLGLYLGLWFVLYRCAHTFVSVAQALSFRYTYRLCWHERFAREFEERPATDTRWDDVIEVP